jgi:hypothetical protein
MRRFSLQTNNIRQCRKAETNISAAGRLQTCAFRRPQSAMKLPPEIEFHPDIRLLVYRPRGLIDEAAINNVISVIEELEAATQEPFNRFSDTTYTHEVELNFRYVIHVSLHRRLSHKGRAPVKSAILATDSTLVHYARLLALLTEGSSIKVQVFQDRKEAAQWLGVPLELLAAKPPAANHSG